MPHGDNNITVLVTGACGVTSRAVVRSLNLSEEYRGRCTFIGTDICQTEYALHEGLYDKVYKVPRFDDSSYWPAMERIIEQEGVQYAICIPEPEVACWASRPLEGVRFFRIPAGFCQRALSKKRLYEVLADTPYIPRFRIVERGGLASLISQMEGLPYPAWMRSYEEGSTSGAGALAVHSPDEMLAWMTINKSIDAFMVSEHLPGRNLACFLMYVDGAVVKYGMVERERYIMSKVVPSGITGNTATGRLVDHPAAAKVAHGAVMACCRGMSEPMNGLVTVDMKEDVEGAPKVTEINLRPVAFVSSMAQAGLNLMEYEMLHLEGRDSEIPAGVTVPVSPGNVILRDVDGHPIYLDNHSELQVGECVARAQARRAF